MSRVWNIIRRFCRRSGGQEGVEYAILTAVVVIGLVVVVKIMASAMAVRISESSKLISNP